jgi:transposase
VPPNKDNIETVIDNALALLESDKTVSPALRAVIALLIEFVKVLSQRQSLNSRNSSTPPASDPNRDKGKQKKPPKRKPGGQPGHVGTTLKLIDAPDTTRVLKVDRRTVPPGEYHAAGHERRQVFDIEISRLVTEYQAEILEDANGRQFVATFPEDVTQSVQYGNTAKAHAVYLSQFQLLPYERIREYFADQLGLPLSAGTLVNFNRQVYNKLSGVDALIRQKLAESSLLHADETGININGSRVWLHVCSNDQWTAYLPHGKRGGEAMEAFGILPDYTGVVCHDHWKAYYTVTNEAALHSLCNAHHQRELTWSAEDDGQPWANEMKLFLHDLNREVTQADGQLKAPRQEEVRHCYRKILAEGDVHCPAPDENLRKPGQRGRLKRSKSRNLLERLRAYEDDVLRFMTRHDIPYTNNLGENDLRMTKVQQKISGCFRSYDGAEIFCRIRGYLSSCRKQGLTATDALKLALEGEMPEGFRAE